jgi:Holliday junction resolvase RusA-like endonuclease
VSKAFQLVILGRPVSTTNSRRIVLNRRTGRRFTIKSAAYAAWATRAVTQLAEQRLQLRAAPFCGDVRVTLTIYRGADVGDLDNFIKGTLDALQESGWLADDKRVRQITAIRQLDRERPRIEITLEAA